VTKWSRQAVVFAAVAAVLIVAAGVAVAGGRIGSSNSEHQALLTDAAKRLDVTPAQLQAALQGAWADRIDAAVAAGRLTKEQADAMKARARNGGGLPGFGGGHGDGDGFGHHGGPGHHGPPLAAAAKYLDLTEAELHAQLDSGKTLAQVAKAQGKSVDGLEQALRAELQDRLDAAVKDGKLTQAQATEIEKRMADHLDAIVNGTAGPGDHDRDGDGHGFGPPPGAPERGGSFAPIVPSDSGA